MIWLTALKPVLRAKRQPALGLELNVAERVTCREQVRDEVVAAECSECNVAVEFRYVASTPEQILALSQVLGPRHAPVGECDVTHAP
jgi:hypothetical protein